MEEEASISPPEQLHHVQILLPRGESPDDCEAAYKGERPALHPIGGQCVEPAPPRPHVRMLAHPDAKARECTGKDGLRLGALGQHLEPCDQTTTQLRVHQAREGASHHAPLLTERLPRHPNGAKGPMGEPQDDTAHSQTLRSARLPRIEGLGQGSIAPARRDSRLVAVHGRRRPGAPVAPHRPACGEAAEVSGSVRTPQQSRDTDQSLESVEHAGKSAVALAALSDADRAAAEVVNEALAVLASAEIHEGLLRQIGHGREDDGAAAHLNVSEEGGQSACNEGGQSACNDGAAAHLNVSEESACNEGGQ